MSQHVFACCQVGVERTLKAEVERALPRLRPAFARPGLVTWVGEVDVDPEVELRAVFARVWGMSLGRATTVDEALALIAAPTRTHFFSQARHEDPPRLHVFARDPSADGAAAEARWVRDALVATGKFAAEARPKPQDLVIDVITAPDEPWLVGAHRHGPGRWAVPGGQPAIEIPADVPSRAYAKIEEAIAWAGLEVAEGQVALELGSAPGGAALALTRRGVTVWAADPGDMDAGVLAYRHASGAHVHHLPLKTGAVRWETLPPRIDWLLVDLHLAPNVALHSIQRFLPRFLPHLRAAVLTLKLNDQRVVDEIPALLDRVRQLGFKDVHATHLPSNRQEICCVAR